MAREHTPERVSQITDVPADVILRMVQLGLKDRVMDTLRRMALSEGRTASAVRAIPKFRRAFLGSIKAGGRVHEIGMLRRYMLKILKSSQWAKLWSGKLLEQAKLGWTIPWLTTPAISSNEPWTLFVPILLTISHSNSKMFIHMARFRMEQIQSLHMRQELRHVLRMEQARLLEMPEEEFNRLMIEVERSPIFRRLYQEERLIRYQRFPRTDISSSFYRLKEEAVANKGSLDLESLLLNKEHVVDEIQKLGLDKFKRYFLFPETGLTEEEIAMECDMTVSEVQKINSLIDDFSILSEFYHPSALNSERIHYSKIASVERKKEGFVIGYFSPSFARGRYSIDYERFEESKTRGSFTETEVKEAKQLFKTLELLNSRKDTVGQILQKTVEQQSLYLESGDSRSLLPFSQKELAKRIGLAPSSVSRAIRGKSIDTPWGEEIPLKHLFPRLRGFRKELIRKLLETEIGLASDEAIRARLRDRFGVAISRRSVANLRKELEIPATGREKQAPSSGE